MSCYSYPEEPYFEIGQDVFIFLLIIEYFLELIAYGMRQDKQKKFFFDTFCTVYYISFFIVSLTYDLNRELKSIFGGILMAMQFLGFLQRNCYFYFSD